MNEQILQTIGFAAPMLTSFYCGLLMLLAGLRDTDRDNRRLTLRMAGVFLAGMVAWASVGCFMLLPEVFAEIHALGYWAAIMVQVLVYHNVFRLTSTRPNERFPDIHYIIAFVLCGTLAVWSLFVPADVRVAITLRHAYPPYYHAYALLFTSKVPVFLFYLIGYTAMAFRRIRRYREAVVHYSADDQHSSVRWLYLLFCLPLAAMPLALGLLAPIVFIRSLAAFLPISLLIVQNILIAYNIFATNYVLIYPSGEEPEVLSPVTAGPDDTNDTDAPEQQHAEQGAAGNGTKTARAIDKNTFEKYMREHKPYLWPVLRITDITTPLKTNRTYLSALINREYGCNFSIYINRLRLQEYERLQNDPVFSHLSQIELIQYAGFGNYNAYRRAKRGAKEAG